MGEQDKRNVLLARAISVRGGGRHFTSQTVSIFNLLEQQDKSAFKGAINNHMLGAIIPKDKELVYNLRRRRCHLPQIKTERYKKTFVNRLIFKYNLV